MSRGFRRWLILLVALAWAAPAAAETLCDPAYQDCRTPLLNLINSETVEIDVAFWFMQDARYESALLSRWKAGVPIRVLVDPRADPTYPGNAQIISDLQNAGIPIRYRLASTVGIMHWKMMLFAGQNTVEFDGANYSPTAFIYEVPYSNYEWESIYFSDDPNVVNSFKTEYDNLWLDTTNYGNFANINGPLTRLYPIYAQDPDLNFPQQQDYALRILKNYSKETQGIDVIMYRVTDERHTDAMIAAMQRGIPVRIISDTFEYRNTSRLWVAYNLDKLYAAGVPLKVRGGDGLNHQKLVIMYGQQMAVFGSSNWTTPSANEQQEHNYFTTKPWMFQWFVDQFDRKWNNTAPNGAIESVPFAPLPPDPPNPLAPANGSVGTLRSMALNWDGGPWGQVYDVYFGTDPNPPLMAANQELGPDDPANPSTQWWSLPLLQPGTTYYWKIVSKTMAGLAKTGPIWSFTTAGNPPPPPSPAPNASTVVIWTSTDVPAANVVGAWQVLTDSTAAGGSALWNPDHGNGKVSPPLAAPASYFYTSFPAVANVPYHVWLRMRAQSNSTSNNSVTFQFNDAIDQYGSDLYRIGTPEGGETILNGVSGTLNNWGWADNTANGQATYVYFPTSGMHTLQIQQRSDGAIVDQIVISPDAFLRSAPGAAASDTTIYGSTLDGAAPPPPPPPSNNPPPPPDVAAPWTHQDVGAVGLPGYANLDSTSTFNIVGAGADVWGSADAFHYVYEPMNGDGSIIARVATLQNVNAWSKAGVMIRESVAPGASNAFMLVSAAKTLSFQTRAATGAATTNVAGPVKAAPYWVRLDRAGNTFTAYYSPDGSTWTKAGTSTITMAATALVGLAVTSHDADEATLATLDNVSIDGVPVVSCGATISPGSQTFGSGGGTATVSVTANSACSWTATSNASWLTVTSGATGTGAGTVTLSATPNSGGALSGTVTIAGNTFTATEGAANCSYSISPGSQSMTASGGTATVNVTTSNWCTWTAVDGDPWVSITSGASGTGNGTVMLNAAANGGGARSSTATIAGQPFVVSEPAASCAITLSPSTVSFTTAAGTSNVAVSTGSWCTWTASSSSPWLTISSAASGTGNGTVTLSAPANSGAPQSATVTVNGQTVAVSQAGAVLPATWSSQDVGSTGKAGSSSYNWSSSVFTLKGAGADVWGTADAFQYAYLPMSGDGTIVARVATVSSTASWVKAGVMIRETLDPSSAQAFMLVSYSKGAAFQRRTVAGGTSTNTAGPMITAPYWVELQRAGNTITASVSPDGVTWTVVDHDTFTMAPNVYVGLAVSSHVNGTLATATFDNVSPPATACNYTVSPATQAFANSGGTATVHVTAGSWCTWTATSHDTSWLTVTGGSPTTGSGTLTLAAAANGGGALSTTVTIGDQNSSTSLAVTESSNACSYTITPGSQAFTTSGGTATVNVTTGSWCTWNATSSAPGWLTVTGGSPTTGSGSVTLSAAANSGPAESATVTIGDSSSSATFAATEAGQPCSYSIAPGSQAFPNGGGSVSVGVTTQTWCTWTATSSAPGWLAVTGGSPTTGSGTATLSAAANSGGPLSATVTIGDSNTAASFSATEAAAACSYAISPASQPVSANGGTVTIAVTTGSWCGWSASSDSSWLTFPSGSSGVGSGTLTASATANGGPAQTATVTIAGLTSTVTQAAPALPGGWSNQDIGAVGKAGSTTYDWPSTTYTIKGAGADIWNTADAFQYAYTTLAGDGTITARVTSVSNTAAWVKAGVMIRETLDPGSAQALMLVSYSKGLAFQRREATGASSVNTAGASVVAPYWVRLVRAGNAFSAYSSPDGATWTLVGTDTIPMASTVYVGLAVSSHVAGTLATAMFDNVTQQ